MDGPNQIAERQVGKDQNKCRKEQVGILSPQFFSIDEYFPK